MASTCFARALALGALAALAAPALGAAVCDDGSPVGSDGCCSDGECPSCCLMSSHAGGCGCYGCAGDALDVGGACSSSDECKTYLANKNDTFRMSTGLMGGGCFICAGEQNTCMTEACKTNALLSMQFSFTDNIVQCGSTQTPECNSTNPAVSWMAAMAPECFTQCPAACQALEAAFTVVQTTGDQDAAMAKMCGDLEPWSCVLGADACEGVMMLTSPTGVEITSLDQLQELCGGPVSAAGGRCVSVGAAASLLGVLASAALASP